MHQGEKIHSTFNRACLFQVSVIVIVSNDLINIYFQKDTKIKYDFRLGHIGMGTRDWYLYVDFKNHGTVVQQKNMCLSLYMGMRVLKFHKSTFDMY